MVQYKIPRDLVIKCCVAMYGQQLNRGCFIDGIPECFYEVAKIYDLNTSSDTSWMLTVEASIKNYAVSMVAMDYIES